MATFTWTLELLEAGFVHCEDPDFVADLFVCRNFENTGVNALFYWDTEKERFFAAQEEYAIDRWKKENPDAPGSKLDRVICAAADQAWLWKGAKMTRRENQVTIIR